MTPIQDFFPIWPALTDLQRQRLSDSAVSRRAAAGQTLHRGGEDCTGLLLVRSGRLRAFALSEEGREITLYRLTEGDICLFSAACVIRGLRFDLQITAETDTALWLIPAKVYHALMQQSAPLANFTNQLMADRLSDVLWLMDQVLWKRQDQRLAAFLLQEQALTGSGALRITHEAIANHLGTAREVVTRMLRYLQGEGMVRLGRGEIEVLSPQGLQALSAQRRE